MKKIEYITAGAGSGKTYTLTHKLADILKEGKICPSEVIVTTFTKAAAAEIKDRARQVLLDEGMVLAAAELDSAAINTTHGVAQMLVNTYWYELDAAPNADLITEEDKRIYRNHSLGQLLEENRFTTEMEAINRYYRRFRPQNKKKNSYQEKDDPEFWAKDVETAVGKMSYYQIENATESIRLSQEQVDKLTQLDEEDRQIMKDCIAAVFHLAEAWQKRYETYKHQIGVIDYDDMERGLRNLLRKESVRQEIAQRYKLVMVDEFQDCNPIQLEIFDMLSDIVADGSPLEQSSIWVGDAKQAIYGFRGSDTELVNRVAAQFPPEGQPATPEGLVRRSLDTSYRTREPLVSLANNLFAQKGRFEGMTRLKSHRGRVEGMKAEAVELWKLPATKRGVKDESLPITARHIREIVEGEEYKVVQKDDDSNVVKLRPLEYGDIALLACNHEQIDQYVEALKAEEVPVWAPETNIIDRAEVQLVLALLQVANSGKQQHEWASLLKLWCNLSTEEVLDQRLSYLASEDNDEKKWGETHPDLVALRVALNHARQLPLDQCMTSLILELGLYERVTKWGEPEVRRQNLMTLQGLAQNFVKRCARLNIPAYIMEFMAYLDDVDVQPSKEMPKNMVKVLTYHGSKGLEWPMVILCSLTHKIVNPQLFVGREIMGMHEQEFNIESDKLIKKYWIHYLPKASGELRGLIEESGVNNWPIADEAKDRLTNESLRLLYVGITRARDFLVIPAKMTSSGLTAQSWLEALGMSVADFKPFKKELDRIHPLMPIEPKTPGENAKAKTVEKYEAAMIQYQKDMEKYEKTMASEAAIEQQRSQPKMVHLPLLPDLEEKKIQDLFLFPSQLTPKDNQLGGTAVKAAQIAPGIEVNAAVDDSEESTLSKSSLGICIHKIFASCPSDGTKPTEAEREAFVAMAAQTLRNCNLSEAVKSPEQLATALFALHEWLTKEYGPAQCIEKEYPFCYSWGDGQIMKGEIDMIWRTEQGDVIVDFKNHVDDVAEIAIDEGCPHAEKYVPQLQAYRKILMDAGRKVKDTLLYYDLKGYIVRVK